MLGALKERQALAKELVARSAALEHAGFHAQVKVTENSTLVFRIVDGQRVAVRPRNGGVGGGNIHETFEETWKAGGQHPEKFSANPPRRPVFQATPPAPIADLARPPASS